MRLYEVVYIFDPALEESAIEAKIEKFHGLLGGTIQETDFWGVRQLAYPIQKQNQGYYVVAQVQADPTALPEFERQVKLDEDVMRYLVVINEGEPTTGYSLVKERPEGTIDPDDVEDDDEEEVDDDDDDSPPEFQGGRGRRSRHEGPSITLLNYKDVDTLSRFLTESGKILPKRTTKVTARFQRQLGSAVKRARYLALIPYVRNQEA
jgi:small subunit ribosomal protein S6